MADRLTIRSRNGLGIATLTARKGVDAAAIGQELGTEMPHGPLAIVMAERTVIGVGPGVWLVVDEDAAVDFAVDLAERLAGLAAVSDQSSGYVVQRLSGSAARTLLRRGAAIDFDPSVFRAGSVASTVIAHISVIVWQVDDQPTYDVATSRSYAGSFRHWLAEASAAL